MLRSRLLRPTRHISVQSEPWTRHSLRHPRHSSSLSNVEAELTSRRLPLIYDNLTTTPSTLLTATLTDFLPRSPTGDDTKDRTDQLPRTASIPLPPSHHLVYFPPATRPSSLLPDGTDPLHSPGPPFHRRMWAGGQILLAPTRTSTPLDCSPYACMEFIRDVSVKGLPGSEKIFVGIERRIGRIPQVHKPSAAVTEAPQILTEEDEERIRTAFYDPSPTAFGAHVNIIERRNLVFMRPHASPPLPPADATTPPPPPKILKPPYAPTYAHPLVPTPLLLFRYSALTFNGHAIHLDKEYCRSVEGHRNLLVHGPLSVTLMVEVLRSWLDRAEAGKPPMVVGVTYRNLAPLYAEEQMRVCVGEEVAAGVYEVWIEGRDGGVCVKGRVTTTPS